MTGSNHTDESQARALAASFNDFGFRLFAQVSGEDKESNVLLSPFGAAAALSLLYLGAEGKTKMALDETLALKGLDASVLARTYDGLRETLTEPQGSSPLSIYNSLWTRIGLTLRPDFVQLVNSYFKAKVESLDFATPAAAQAVNDWVKGATNGKIARLLERDELSADTILLLLSVVHFKGVWQRPFDASKTAEGTFKLADGNTRPVQMMSQSGSYLYCEAEDFRAVELPYADAKMSMLIFLAAGDCFVESLNVKRWEEWLSRFSGAGGEVRLPRLNLSYEVKLKGALQALGAAEIFRPGADFRNLSDAQGFVTDIKQQATVEVTEEGTEAAAATSVEMGRSLQRRFSFIADRPFFWFIKDNRTGSILFIGKVTSP
ncbi:MAG: serpin family protein [Pyrinomonadaceae bacterium]|nr:serpin family protein [Pyrinomonadaceae bacterium]